MIQNNLTTSVHKILSVVLFGRNVYHISLFSSTNNLKPVKYKSTY